MKFKVTKQIFSKFPNAKFGALLIEGVDNTKEVGTRHALFNVISEVLERYKDVNIKDIPQIKSWREVFKQLDLNRNFLPSHEALLRRVMSKKELPQINPLVDIYNIISLKYLLPIGGHDTDKVKEIRIDETKGRETFIVMGTDKTEKINKEEFAYMDGNKILTRNFVWRQAETDKTTKKTRNIFIPIDDAPGNLSTNKIEEIASELARLITKYLGGSAKFGIVDRNNPEINFEKVKEMKIKDKKVNVSKGIKVNTDSKAIDEFLDRGPVEIFTREELKKKMMSGEKLRAYIGYDVTGPDLHLGNGCTMMKLRDWQQLGHHTILVIGDYTTRVGDHSDKLEKRKRLSVEEIEQNKKKFKEQFGRIVDLDSTEIRYNSEWLEPLTFNDVVNLASLFSVQQMIERENFAIRLKKNKTIGLEELLYPLMQGYDSVALKVDLEMGGTDQTFNLLAGRKIMEAFGMKPQNVITMPLIPGTDGRKMSKSWENYIPMLASANDLYGGIMSCCDEVVIEYFRLLTRVPLKETDEMKKELAAGKADPMELKKRLAFEVTKIYYDAKEAQKAQEHFEKTVQKGEVPDEMEEISYKGKPIALELAKFLVEKGLIPSNAEAKRLIKQGGLEVDRQKVTDLEGKFKIKKGSVIKIGKRRFIRLV